MKARTLFLSLISAISILGAEARAEVFTLSNPLSGPCQISLELRGPREVREGRDADYEIRVRELSGCTLTTLRVEDFLAEGLRFDRAHPRPDDIDHRDGRTEVIWEDQLLRPFEAREYRIRADVKDPRGWFVRNVACVRNRHLTTERFCVEIKSRIERRDSREDGAEIGTASFEE